MLHNNQDGLLEGPICTPPNKKESGPSASVIIASSGKETYLNECLMSLLNQSVDKIEIICIVDSERQMPITDSRIRTIIDNRSPSTKRNIGISLASSDVIAFIDDDAQAPPDWIAKGIKMLEQECVAGGPNIVHPNDSTKQKASDAFFSSWFGSFREVYRYRPMKEKTYADNLGTVNLFTRRSTIVEVGGFDGSYWPGEDTNLCERLKKRGIRLRYDATLFVYHHRRDTLRGHLKQIWRYAVYRGSAFLKGEVNYFYLGPSLILISLIALVAFSIDLDRLLLIPIILASALISTCAFLDFYRRHVDLKVAFLGLMLFWSSHLVYGVGVIKGLIWPKQNKHRSDGQIVIGQEA